MVAERKLRYQVHPLTDQQYDHIVKTVEQVELKNGKKKGKIKDIVERRPRGFLVTFSKGHSIHVKDKEHLRRLGLDVPPDTVNPEGTAEINVQDDLVFANAQAHGEL